MIWYDIWYDIYDIWYDIWYDIISYIIYDIWYDIWYDMIWWYDIWYILTAIGLTPGASSTVHIYTQTIHRRTQSSQTLNRTTQFTDRNRMDFRQARCFVRIPLIWFINIIQYMLTSPLPSVLAYITRFRRQFLSKMWPNHSTPVRFTARKMFLPSWLYVILKCLWCGASANVVPQNKMYNTFVSSNTARNYVEMKPNILSLCKIDKSLKLIRLKCKIKS
jgi:hypothetical protein